MRGRIHFRIQLDALRNRVVHATLHEAAMVHVLHVMRRCRRFFLFTLSRKGSRCRDRRQQNRSAHCESFLHGASPSVVPSVQPETSLIILPRSEQRNRTAVRVARSEHENWKMETRKWKSEIAKRKRKKQKCGSAGKRRGRLAPFKWPRRKRELL